MKLEGLYTAMVTPFDEQGALDEEGLRYNLRYQLQHRVEGILVLGSTGEAPTLHTNEKKKVQEIAVEEVKGRAIVMVGTGSYSTTQTIIATKEAEEIGADVALIVIPYYNKPTQEGIYRHFAAICEATSLPICIYNAPGRTAQNLQPDTLRRLALFPSIVAVKETGGNMTQIQDVIQSIQERPAPFAVLSGDDEMTLPLMALGGNGCISVLGNLMPGPVRALIQAAAAGDFALARLWHYRLLPLFKASFMETNPIPIKAAMQLCGLPSGSCRLPLCHLDPHHAALLEQLLNAPPSDWLGDYGQKKSSRIETTRRVFIPGNRPAEASFS